MWDGDGKALAPPGGRHAPEGQQPPFFVAENSTWMKRKASVYYSAAICFCKVWRQLKLQ